MRLGLPARNCAPRPRRARRLFAVGAVAAFVIVVTACTVPPPSQPPKVILYGDSLSVEAAQAFTARIQAGGSAQAIVRASGGVGICDWFDEMDADLPNFRPTAVVLEFAGNSLPSCVANSGLSPMEKYRQDAITVINKFKPQGVHVYLVSTPVRAVGNGSPETPDPWRDMFFTVAVENGVRFADAGHALFNHATGLYQFKMPCGPGEGPAQGCSNNQIQVRDPTDGLHFCPTGQRPLPCDNFGVHVSGAFRYGNSMGNIVALQLGF